MELYRVTDADGYSITIKLDDSVIEHLKTINVDPFEEMRRGFKDSKIERIENDCKST